MRKSLTSLYRPFYPGVLVYMLQSTEYNVSLYVRWLWRTKDFGRVMQRRQLDRTRRAQLLLFVLWLGILIEIAASLYLMYRGIAHHQTTDDLFFGIALLIVYPLLWSHLIVVPLLLGKWFVAMPADRQVIAESEPIFAKHPGVKIAVVGSYGKTTMKELLLTVLSEGKKVAATPANKNVSISHAHFARKLAGDEDILIIEYGEGAPGDVARFAKLTHPTHAVITGLAPAHLDQYKTLQAAGEDIFSVAQAKGIKQVYVNADSRETKPFQNESYELFSDKQALGWKINAIHTDVSGTRFTIQKDGQKIELHSNLVGRHQVGYLAFVAAFALQQGLTAQQVEVGIAATKPFEHRMQPYQLNGAWIIDDTYNGNLEGIRAGTQLLADLPADRKTYVTPGLVDQGEETEKVHYEVGKLIAVADPDTVVLMKNSVTNFIRSGLKAGDYKGTLQIEDNPLQFYTNLNQFVANGDLVVMQNDWMDNYF